MEEKSIAIKVESISKCYRIGLKENMHDNLAETIFHFIKNPLKNYRKYRSLYNFDDVNPEQNSNPSDIIWSLRDVSFEVKKGEAVGVIGANGAGKSTLLKILSKITDPTSGCATIHGRVSSLLEVGTGFHPELTGRDNVYLNGTILGMRKTEIDGKFDEIVDFSGVEKFIDTPVKRYSSGMKVRLAFAVAAHLDPEILLIDEVLAVGDIDFQKKCLRTMDNVTKEGRTVLFVSHNMAAIIALCPRAILLRAGKVFSNGPCREVVEQYLGSGKVDDAERFWNVDELPSSCGPFRPIAMRVRSSGGTVTDMVLSTQPFFIEMEYEVTEAIRDLRVGLYLWANLGEFVFMSADRDDVALYEEYAVRFPGRYVSRCRLPANLFNKGSYTVGISVATANPSRKYFREECAIRFAVDISGGVGTRFGLERGGVLRPALDWEIECVSRVDNSRQVAAR